MLADVFPGLEPWRWLIELVLPILIVGFVLLALTTVLRVLLVSAIVQLTLLLVFGAVVLAHHGPHASSFTHAHHIAHSSANVGLLFVCGSLPLFLGGEVSGGARTIRRSLAVAGGVVALYVVFAAFPLAAVDPSLVHSNLPGYEITKAYEGRTLAVVIGLGAVLSVAGVIVAEYLALSRLLFAVTGVPIRRVLLWIGVPFVGIDALSLIDPEEFDEKVLRPSLIALYLSQLIVFAVFPLYRRRRGRLTAFDVVLAAGAFALMSWGLWRAITAPVST
jgi:hypothetical protein